MRMSRVYLKENVDNIKMICYHCEQSDLQGRREKKDGRLL